MYFPSVSLVLVLEQFSFALATPSVELDIRAARTIRATRRTEGEALLELQLQLLATCYSYGGFPVCVDPPLRAFHLNLGKTWVNIMPESDRFRTKKDEIARQFIFSCDRQIQILYL